MRAENQLNANPNASAVSTSNVQDAQGNLITDVTNGSPGETNIGTQPAANNLWGGCCSETHIAARIANALANGGRIVGTSGTVLLGMAHTDLIPPCGNCLVNLALLAQETGFPVRIGYFLWDGYEETGNFMP